MKTAEQHEAESLLRTISTLMERWHKGGDGNGALDLMAELRLAIRPEDKAQQFARLNRLSEGSMLAAETRIKHMLDQSLSDMEDRSTRMIRIEVAAREGIIYGTAYSAAAVMLERKASQKN